MEDKEKKTVKLKESLAAKIVAVILLAVMALISFCSLGGVFYLFGDDCFRDNATFYDLTLCSQITSGYAHGVWGIIDFSHPDSEQAVARLIEDPSGRYNAKNTNFLFVLRKYYQKRNLVVSIQNCNGESANYVSTYLYDYSDGVNIWEIEIEAYVRSPITAKDDYYIWKQLFDFLHSWRYVVLGTGIAALALSVALFVFLMRAAGHKKGAEGITRNWLDKIPLDLYAVICGGSFLACGFFSANLMSYSYSWTQYAVYDVTCLVLALLGCGLSLLAFILSLATRIKLGGFWRNTLIWRFGRLLRRVFKRIGAFLSFIIGCLPIAWKIALAYAVTVLINLVVIAAAVAIGYEAGVILVIFMMIFNLAVIFGLCILAVQLNELKRAGSQLAGGSLTHKTDTSRLLWDLKEHGDNLNSIGIGMAKAVDERMKSERLKTELITNVSHDIKTPLTSIINYIDLLKRDGADSKKAAEYFEVLERQSERLRKLTEDVIEASKASSGAISVNNAETDVSVLLRQAVGEYEERLRESGLQAVVSAPLEPVMVVTDGKLIWRVFDNLLSNICKYSQHGTRVYFGVDDTGFSVSVTFRNISREPLNISADELMERFTRGEKSRAGDGSGLGLSIARSLTELCGGKLSLYLDGDLFKATMDFKRDR